MGGLPYVGVWGCIIKGEAASTLSGAVHNLLGRVASYSTCRHVLYSTFDTVGMYIECPCPASGRSCIHIILTGRLRGNSLAMILIGQLSKVEVEVEYL